MQAFKSLARRLAPRWSAEGARRLAEKADPHLRLSWSQDGEDMVLRRMFEGQRYGFYVDVGAHDPFRFSNTCFFHRLGWSGINVDANPRAIEAFRRARPSDVNLCVGVAGESGTLVFHQFNEPALDTFDAGLAVERAALPDYKLVGTSEVVVMTLSDILARHLPEGQEIDFLSIDVEGLDLDVLRSNDWRRFRPRVLLVEARGADISALPDDPACHFARGVGYVPVAKTLNTVLFERQEGV